MNLFVAGLSYKTAPVAVRERLAVGASKLICQACRLKVVGRLDEVVLLSTCNRVEIYGTTARPLADAASLLRYLVKEPVDVGDAAYCLHDEAALQHLFAVASGLDSMVLGETEITGQVKEAYEKAHRARLTGPVLNRVLQKALQAAKETRTRTGIGRGATSVGSVAVELAEQIFGKRLADQTVMIIGAGRMGETCVRHLAKKGAKSILVSNRSFERAQALAAEFQGRAVRFDDCLEAMAGADIVVGSTGCPQVILHRPDVERLMQRRCSRPLFLIDIAVPRDIDPEVQRLENAFLYNIDDLEAIVRENVRHREEDVAACRAIIARKTAALVARFTDHRKDKNERAVQPEPGWVLCGAVAGRG